MSDPFYFFSFQLCEVQQIPALYVAQFIFLKTEIIIVSAYVLL